jgi:hypothetical protein
MFEVTSFLKVHDDFDQEDLYGLPTLLTTAKPINGFQDYLRSTLPKMEYAPDQGNVDRVNLIRVLSLALRQELSYPLRLESASLLIQSGLGSELSRHDVFLFQSFLAIMLRESTEYYRDMAALSFCENGLVDDFVIQHLMTGLGDVNSTRRAKLNSLISNLESKHTKNVMCILLSETRNLNFKIRQDAVWHLATYVKRMNDATKRGGARTPLESKKSWSSYDSNEFISQKEVTVANENPELPQQPAAVPLPPVRRTADFDLDPREMTSEMLIDEAIDTLLRIMWDDWVIDVRDTASQTLGKLGQGTAVFERIVMLMQHQDMHKRVEALKCFSFMSVMTHEALKSLIVCLSDPYMIVRIQACKVACALHSEDLGLIHALLDRLDDFEWSVRAYAVKGISLIPC